MDHRIAVVGGGITGLALLHELRKRGADAVVLEAAEKPGGVIRSVAVDGRVLDIGPQRARLVAPLERLVAELGLGDELVRAPPGLPLFIWREGRLRRVPRSVAELLTSDLLSTRGKLRLLLEPPTAPARRDETVGAFFRRSFGEEAYRVLLGPLFGGVYGSDPARMRVRHSLAGLLGELGVRRSLLLAFLRRGRTGPAAPAAVTFRDGMQALPQGLAQAHAGRVRLETSVHSVERSAGGWALETSAGRTTAETVVLAVPADAAAAILRAAAPETAARLDGLVYNPLAVVHLRSEAELEGYGYQVAFGEDLATRGVTWNAGLFGGQGALREGVYTAYLGGARDRGAADRGDAELGETAAREFAAVTGHRARVLRVSRTRIPAFDLSWDALEGLDPPPGIRLCGSYVSRPGITGRLKEAREVADAVVSSGRGTRS